MHFASDNASPAHPKVLDAIVRANANHRLPYGNDPLSVNAVTRIREVFEAPEASVYLVVTGTAANALALATLSMPWQSVFCATLAHVEEDECGAPEFFGGSTKLTLIDGPDAKMSPDALDAAIRAAKARGLHASQPGPVTLTQVTERGTLYSLDEIAAVSDVARHHGLPVHLDGARFANAVVALGCSAAEMSWKAGVDAVSFGGTKNGLMGVEAVVIFDPARARDFELRRKRGAHLLSKHCYLAAQMDVYLQDGLWLDLAARANAAGARLAAGLATVPGIRFAYTPGANMLFVTWPRAMHQAALKNGAVYNMIDDDLEGDDPTEPLLARLVCGWSTDNAEVDACVAMMEGVARAHGAVPAMDGAGPA